MKKLLKISTFVAIAGLVAFNTYMASDIFKSNGTDLASVFSLSEVMAELTDEAEDDNSTLRGCYDCFDPPVWYWNDTTKRVCTDPEGNGCITYFGSGFGCVSHCTTPY
jgi:hypothetical protein